MGLYLVANCLHHAHPLYFWRILSVRHPHWFQVPPQFLHQSVGEQNDQIHCHKSTDKQSQVGVFQSLEWQEQLLWLYVPTQLCLYVPTMYQPDILRVYVLTPPHQCSESVTVYLTKLLTAPPSVFKGGGRHDCTSSISTVSKFILLTVHHFSCTFGLLLVFAENSQAHKLYLNIS